MGYLGTNYDTRWRVDPLGFIHRRNHAPVSTNPNPHRRLRDRRKINKLGRRQICRRSWLGPAQSLDQARNRKTQRAQVSHDPWTNLCRKKHITPTPSSPPLFVSPTPPPLPPTSPFPSPT